MADADAWLWLIEHAAWKPLRRRAGQGQSIVLERGQIYVSDRSLATAFRWDKKRVRRYLERLQMHEMATQLRDQFGTILTICNYDKYQVALNELGPVKGPLEDQQGTSLTAGKERTKSAADTGSGTTHKRNNSVSKETGVPPADIVKSLFDLGVTLLAASGHDERASRSIVGRWRKSYSDGEVMAALIDCQRLAITNPVEWMPKRLARPASSAEGHADYMRRKYRNAA